MERGRSSADASSPLLPAPPRPHAQVKAADLSVSPVHRAAAGLVDPVKGIALRFPRLLRVRDDKKVEDATTSTQVAQFYGNQQINHRAAAPAADEDDE